MLFGNLHVLNRWAEQIIGITKYIKLKQYMAKDYKYLKGCSYDLPN